MQFLYVDLQTWFTFYLFDLLVEWKEKADYAVS